MSKKTPNQKYNYKELKSKVEKTVKDIEKRFPNSGHTVIIKLWQDGTMCVECKHGGGGFIHKTQIYDDEMTHSVHYAPKNGIFTDEFGTEYFPKL